MAGPAAVLAATAPSLGTTAGFGIVSSTSTNANTAPQTIINGSVCGTTLNAPRPLIVTDGPEEMPCLPIRGVDQAAALAIINGQACTPVAGTLNGVIVGGNAPGTFPPGCYSVVGAMNITTGTTVTLDATALGGDGGNVWIFRSSGALTTGASTAGFPSVVLANGASAANVFWAPGAAATIGANFALSLTPTFVGTIITDAGISFGHFANVLGRALNFATTVTTDANTVSVPSTLRVIKTVINDNGGVATSASFNLHVRQGIVDVAGSPAIGVAAPGRLYTLLAGSYVVSEDPAVSYSQSFSGDCDALGNVVLGSGQNLTCTITNNDIPGGGGGGNQPSTVNVVKLIVNDSGSGKVVSDFQLFVDATSVMSGITNVFPAIPGIYSVSETGNAGYSQSFSGDCDVNGQFNLTPGQNKFCIVTNDDIGQPAVVPSVPPLIDVVKVPFPLSLPNGPGPVTYTYTLRNIGTVSAGNVTMVGDTCSPILLASGDLNGDARLDLNETWVHTCNTYLDATHTNTVVAMAWASGISATDIASATVVVGLPIVPPLIHVTKVASRLTLPAGGGEVTYTERITNPGTVPLANVSLNDDKCAVQFVTGDANGDSLLDISETWTYRCTVNLLNTTTNTATATGSANGFTARDLAVATVVVAAAVPSLPQAGAASSGSSGLAALAAGIVATALVAYVIRKKRTA